MHILKTNETNDVQPGPRHEVVTKTPFSQLGVLLHELHYRTVRHGNQLDTTTTPTKPEQQFPNSFFKLL